MSAWELRSELHRTRPLCMLRAACCVVACVGGPAREPAECPGLRCILCHASRALPGRFSDCCPAVEGGTYPGGVD